MNPVLPQTIGCPFKEDYEFLYRKGQYPKKLEEEIFKRIFKCTANDYYLVKQYIINSCIHTMFQTKIWRLRIKDVQCSSLLPLCFKRTHTDKVPGGGPP